MGFLNVKINKGMRCRFVVHRTIKKIGFSEIFVSQRILSHVQSLSTYFFLLGKKDKLMHTDSIFS